MEKNRISTTINGRMYTFESDESIEYMQKLTDIVNQQIDAVKKGNTMFGERSIVLAALNICDKYMKAEKGGRVIIDKMQKKYDEIVAENKKLNDIINQSDYEIDISLLRSQLDAANKEIERLKNSK